MSNTYTVEFEHTDTFCGEANYCWVNREEFELPSDISDLALVRRAKKWAGLNGVRCRVDNLGDRIDIRPYGICQILFIQTVY